MSTLLLYGDSERSPAIRHELPVSIGDPLMFAEIDGRPYVLTSILERERIKRALPDAELLDFFDLGLRDLITSGLPLVEAERETVLRAVRELGIERATVPGDFPLGLGDRLRDAGIELTIDDEAVMRRRRVKKGAELEGVLVAQRAAEEGMAAARELLFSAGDDGEGRLVLDGQLLLAEDVREAARAACARAGAPCPPDVIVSSIWQGYGHDPGSGPLPAGLPVVIDLWPRHDESACWADMTRTYVVGEPRHADVVEEQRRLVAQALADAKAGIRPGIRGRELFDRTCDLFEAAGKPTQRTAPDGDTVEGFQFALGHGVGLEVHEPPYLGMSGSEPLVVGDVLALEPGLNDMDAGEVRFEDLVIVTEEGCETLTRFSYDLTP